MVRDTSKEIYNKIVSNGLLSKKRLQIYDIIYNLGSMTGSQVAQIYKENYNASQHSESIRNRITELTQQGVVKEVKTGDCAITGKKVLWFDVTSKLPVKIQRQATKKEKKDEVLKLIFKLDNTITTCSNGMLLDVIKQKVLDL